jgi:hypothetical protein
MAGLKLYFTISANQKFRTRYYSFSSIDAHIKKNQSIRKYTQLQFLNLIQPIGVSLF